jgi:5-methyltetrahydropteroyltriglutamate--homocysteine methyltransferase
MDPFAGPKEEHLFRADHVGSLLRPRVLLEARGAFARGQIGLHQLRLIEDHAILDVLSMQRQTGINILSDGEFRRSSWLGGILENVRGLAATEPRVGSANKPDWRGVGETVAREDTAVPTVEVVGKLSAEARFTEVEGRFLKEHAAGPFKITLPSPHLLMHLYQPGTTERIYQKRKDMLADIVSICRREVDALAQDGVPYIQIDSLRYTDILDERRRRKWEAIGVEKVLDETIAADNAVLAGAKRAGVTRGVHMCRGNHRSAWAGEGGYEMIAEKLFSELDTDRFLLEYDDERSGGFEPLRFVPEGKIVVLGLVTTKIPALESRDELRRRIDEAAKYVPLERLAISPQCGFASTHLGNLLTEAEEMRKLELVAETARAVWG